MARNQHPDSAVGALAPAQEAWRAQRENAVLPALVRPGRLGWLWAALLILLVAVTVVIIVVGDRL
jgi:hypothetical protein